MELGAVQLTRTISVVDIDGSVFGGDADQVVTQLAQDVANGEDAQHPRIVEESEFLFQPLEHVAGDRLG